MIIKSKNSNIKVVIMMATYNGEKYIRQQIKSIEEQTFTNWSLYISDDCSNDSTLKILKRLKLHDSRIKKIIINKKYHGAFANYFNVMNYVKNNCKNYFNYFFYCDQDDIWAKDKIEIQIKVLQRIEKNYPHKAAFCYSDLELCDRDLQDMHDKISKHITVPFFKNPYNEFFKEQYVWGTTIGHNLKFWNDLPVESVNVVKNNISHDSYIARFAAVEAIIEYIPQTLVMYRRTGNNVTTTPQNYTLKEAIKRIFTKSIDILNDSSRTYSVSLYLANIFPWKNQFLFDLKKAILGGPICSIKFFKKYKILEKETFWGNLSTKVIFYSGIYKKNRFFKKIY